MVDAVPPAPPPPPPGNRGCCAAGLGVCLLHRRMHGYRRADLSLGCIIFGFVFHLGWRWFDSGGNWKTDGAMEAKLEENGSSRLAPLFRHGRVPLLQNRIVLRILAHGGISQNLPWDLDLPSDFRNLGNCLSPTGTGGQCPAREA